MRCATQASRASLSERRRSGPSCSACSSALPALTTSGAPCIIFVMPDLTTSRSTSSTGSRVRAPPISRRTSTDALALEPEHLSCYELEAKPGTRFTHAWAEELGRQAEAMEDYFERVVATLTGAGYRWYETANFCRTDARSRSALAAQPRPTGSAATTSASGSARSSTIDGLRRRNTPKLGRYLEALAAGRAPERELEPLDDDVRARERVMLGLRLDEPLPLAGLRHALDPAGLARVEQLGPRRGDRPTR